VVRSTSPIPRSSACSLPRSMIRSSPAP
jgi:hypothetical protein